MSEKKEEKKLKIGVVGAGGRIGKELLNILIQGKDFYTPFLGIGRNSIGFEHNFNSIEELVKNSSHILTDNQSKLDAIIDFSSPELFSEVVKFCANFKIPLVSGTTGLKENDFKTIEEKSSEVPILWSPNMSLGVAMVKKSYEAFSFLKNINEPKFDIVMEEWHHNRKKDSPSGTALMLVKKIESELGRKISDTQSFRAGGIFGEHHLHLVSDEEHIVVSHKALNRTVFAKGAVVAANWIVTKKPALYSMDDVLKV